MSTENNRNMFHYKTNKILCSTLSRDELQPDIHEVNVLLRDWILIMKNYLVFADVSNFGEDIKFNSLFDIAQAYRFICLRNKKNMEANLKNSTPYIQKMVLIVQKNRQILLQQNPKILLQRFPEEYWVNFFENYIDSVCYIHRFRDYY